MIKNTEAVFSASNVSKTKKKISNSCVEYNGELEKTDQKIFRRLKQMSVRVRFKKTSASNMVYKIMVKEIKN